MFAKYNDTPAAIAIGVVTIFFIIQVVLICFTAETFLEDSGINPAGLPLVYWMCGFLAILSVGLILTFIKGPDGQSIFFNVMLIAQIGSVIGQLIEYATDAGTKSPPAILALTIVLAALYFFGYFRLRSRL